MIVTIGEEKFDIRKTDAHRHKYDTALTEFICTARFDELWDRSSGDVECPTGYFALIGRRIVVSDDRGFVWTETYPEKLAAEQVYNALDLYYCEWADEESSEEIREANLQDADAYLAYVVECAKENAGAYSFRLWKLGRYKGPLG